MRPQGQLSPESRARGRKKEKTEMGVGVGEDKFVRMSGISIRRFHFLLPFWICVMNAAFDAGVGVNFEFRFEALPINCNSSEKVICSLLMSRLYLRCSSSCLSRKNVWMNGAADLLVSYLHTSQSFHVSLSHVSIPFVPIHRLFFPCGQKKNSLRRRETAEEKIFHSEERNLSVLNTESIFLIII